MLSLVEELVRRGHTVTWLSQPSVRARASAARSRFVAFDHAGDYDPTQPIEEQLDLALALLAGRTTGDQLLDLARREQADLVLLDANLAGAAAALETLAAPSAIVLHSLYRTFTDVWFGELWPYTGPPINATRAEYGLAPAGSWPDVFAAHDRLLAAVPEAFDAPVAAPPPSWRHFGFLVPRGHTAAVPEGFGPDETPTVLVSLSTTYQRQEELLDRILAAVAGRPLRALVTTAGRAEPTAVPANAVVHDFVAHGALLPHTDAVVTHGGLGTIAGALAHGVPSVCIPLGRDQSLNAARVAATGAGLALDPDAGPETIAAAIDRVLGEPAFRAGAQSLAEASARAGGAAAAVTDLESLPGG